MTDPTEPGYRDRDRRLDRKIAKLFGEYGIAAVSERTQNLADAWGSSRPLTLPAVTVTRGGPRYQVQPTAADSVIALLSLAESLDKQGVVITPSLLRGLAAGMGEAP